MAKKNANDGRQMVANNKKARHDFEIIATYEAGLVLMGTEVKSLRMGRASLLDAFCQFDRSGELWLEHAHIPEYLQGSWTNHSARRRRKLLLHRSELDRIAGKTREAGYIIIPLALYFVDNKRVKVEIAVARGKREYDKRQTLREKQDNREAQRAMRYRNMRA